MNPRGSEYLLFPRPLCRAMVAIVLSASLLLSGCVSVRSVPIPTPGQSSQTVAVKVGDKVRVLTKSGEKLKFEVTVIEPAALVGKVPYGGNIVRVKYQDIGSLQLEKMDKTGTAVVVTIVIIAVVGVILIASGPHWSGPLFPPGSF